MRPEEVPDELVELAARAFHWSYAALVDPEAPPVDYASLPPSLRERYEQTARHGLAAVLPLHEVAVRREVAQELEADRPEVGTHVNVSQYRQGKYDGLTVAAARLRNGGPS